jgi:quercetin dioxygenase-like cupin family protein
MSIAWRKTPSSEGLPTRIGRAADVGGDPVPGRRAPCGGHAERGTLSAAAITLAAGGSAGELTPAGFEIVYLVVSGAIQISLFGGLHGTIRSGTYVHVRDGVRHHVGAEQDCQVLGWQVLRPPHLRDIGTDRHDLDPVDHARRARGHYGTAG